MWERDAKPFLAHWMPQQSNLFETVSDSPLNADRSAEIAESRAGIIAGMEDDTQVLSRLETGDPGAANELLSLVHNELRKLAAQRGPWITLYCERPTL